MLLSIVLMIKNEEQYLDKTLRSLINLRKNIDNELIILDTGSTDKSIDIAKKYTDKIYYEKWNDHFGEMRNKSISYAKGEWILVLDADEELIEDKKLIEFFRNELYKKYNSASVFIKSIHSEDEKGYSNISIVRLFKNSTSFKYEGAIHEQPLYKYPTCENLAVFKHYGYLFCDEELKQKKLKRNEKILFNELKKDKDNPYMNYQLGKNHMAYKNNIDAFTCIYRSYELYSKNNYIPAFVTINLARLYNELDKNEKCEALCLKYIKNDDKNIDIYYYLAFSQKKLSKYEDSIKNYNRYIYLIDNYEISTQANNIECIGDTIALKENAIIDIINMYYKLEKYNEVLNNIDFNNIKNVYMPTFMSMYKLKKSEEILSLYIQSTKTQVERSNFIFNLEKMIFMVKEEERKPLYELFSKIDGNYGVLNSLRLDRDINIDSLRKLLKEEKDSYYGDVIYYLLADGKDIDFLIEDTNYASIQKYIEYIVVNKTESILYLYQYLLSVPNTLDIKKMCLYTCILKTLLKYGALIEGKYNDVFKMYITYRYDVLRYLYNEEILDEEIVNYINDKDDLFVISVNICQKIKLKDALGYIKKMKEILIDNPIYKKGIQLLINEFEHEINESEEIKKLRDKYISIIEENIQRGNFKESLNLIEEYEDIFKSKKLYNAKAIINIYNNNIEEAERLLKLSYINNKYDENTIFNIAYIKERQLDINEAIMYYSKIVTLDNNLELKDEVHEILNRLKSLDS